MALRLLIPTTRFAIAQWLPHGEETPIVVVGGKWNNVVIRHNPKGMTGLLSIQRGFPLSVRSLTIVVNGDPARITFIFLERLPDTIHVPEELKRYLKFEQVVKR
ncbi:MAG: hypothetical protein ACPLKP_00760 [Microgenomates group bacterium]